MHLVIEKFEWNAKSWITHLSAIPASRVPLCTTRFSWPCMYSRSIARLFSTFDIVKQPPLPSPHASCLLMPQGGAASHSISTRHILPDNNKIHQRQTKAYHVCLLTLQPKHIYPNEETKIKITINEGT